MHRRVNYKNLLLSKALTEAPFSIKNLTTSRQLLAAASRREQISVCGLKRVSISLTGVKQSDLSRADEIDGDARQRQQVLHDFKVTFVAGTVDGSPAYCIGAVGHVNGRVVRGLVELRQRLTASVTVIAILILVLDED